MKINLFTCRPSATVDHPMLHGTVCLAVALLFGLTFAIHCMLTAANSSDPWIDQEPPPPGYQGLRMRPPQGSGMRLAPR
jgi:hypothetical protein